ncbi:hypothetical protein ACVQ92_09570 [Staphylococcus aureus]
MNFIINLKKNIQSLNTLQTKHELDVAPMFKSLIGKEISEEDANHASGLTAVCSIINLGEDLTLYQMKLHLNLT